MKINQIINSDCMEYMRTEIPEGSVNLTFTDIPYDMVNRASNGLRNLDKGDADILTFELQPFLTEIYRITKGTIIIFCGVNQVSEIYRFFADKQKNKEGTVRQIIWEKSNPSPMNGQSIYLSGVENAIWFKKRGGSFNAHCKNTVFKYPVGRSKNHPTEKNHFLLQHLILDNSNENDIVFDPCAGSGSHLFVAKSLNRQWLGTELKKEYFDQATNIIKELVK
jgi:site-specific DNA-methyltransferase (adenine-specific)